MYRVVAQRHGKWWVLIVPAVPGAVSQARRLDQVDWWIRDAIALVLEVPEDSFDIEVDVQLPKDELAELRTLKAEQAEAARLQESSSERTKTLIGQLEAEGLTRRDIGRVLGVSHQRVSQLAA